MTLFRVSTCFAAVLTSLIMTLIPQVSRAADAAAVMTLTQEVSKKGWIAFAGKSKAGDYDIFVARPDGSEKRNITNTPEFSEVGVRWSNDGKKVMYRKPALAMQSKLNHDNWGGIGSVIIADADGSNPVEFGGKREFPWVCWAPNDTSVSTLYKRAGVIRIYNIASSEKIGGDMPRKGIFQQLFMSADGKYFTGTANFSGRDWNVVSYEVASKKVTLVSQGLNCTPDFFRTNNTIIYAHRDPGVGVEDASKLASTDERGAYGCTIMLKVDVAGKKREILVAEQYRHIYFARTSPDDKYIIYSRLPRDGAFDAPMAIVRMADTPVLDGAWPQLKAKYKNVTFKDGPVLHLSSLPMGFEPDWTYAEVFEK